MAQTPVKLGTFQDLMLDRQIEELVSYARSVAESTSGTAEAPTTISALTTAGGFGHVRLEYSYTSYNGHKYTEVWRSADTTFANAERVGATAAHFYQDFPPNPQISEVLYYWVRNVNMYGVEGDLYGPVSGSVGSNPDYDLEMLLGQLGFGHFANGTYPIRTEPTFPTLPATNYPVDCIIYLTTNQLLYKNVNEAWQPVMAAEDMVGEITNTQIADGAISTPKLQALSVAADNIAASAIVAGKIAAGALAVDDGVMQNGYIKNAHITDCSVSKLIAGIISAGDIYLGIDSLIHLDGANQRIVVSDGTYNRVVIGKLGTDWGIEIRDDSNNIILTNNGVNWASVVGTGRPADGADVTANNPQGASWLTDAVVYAGNKISEANIGNYMSSAAIVEAYIKDAQVSTLKIQENAVTVPVGAYTAGNIALGESWVTIQQATINALGQPVSIYYASAYNITWASTGSVTGELYCRLVYSTGTEIIPEYMVERQSGSPGVTLRGTFSFSTMIFPAGSVTVYLQIRLNTTSGLTQYNNAFCRYLGLIGMKR